MLRWLLEPFFRHALVKRVDGLAERSRFFSLLVDAVAVVVVLALLALLVLLVYSLVT